MRRKNVFIFLKIGSIPGLENVTASSSSSSSAAAASSSQTTTATSEAAAATGAPAGPTAPVCRACEPVRILEILLRWIISN